MKMMLFVLLLFSIERAWGQTMPHLINYQGRLANADGSPFPTADYELRIFVYDASTNGNLIWGPQFFDGLPDAGHAPRVPVVQGHFNVMIGPVDVAGRAISDAFSASNRFVQVTVSNRPPFYPRQQILTTPYAFNAANGSPPGTVVAFAGHESKVPPGWLLCNGASVTTNQFPALFDAIGRFWGGGDGNTNSFSLPDLRGMFLRGVTGTRSDAWQDPLDGRVSRLGGVNLDVGSYQGDEFKGHDHAVPAWPSSFGPGERNAMFYRTDLNNGSSYNVSSRGGTETRPRNVAVNYIVKY